MAAGLSLVYVVQRLGRPTVAVLARDPMIGAWAGADRHPDWTVPDGVLVAPTELDVQSADMLGELAGELRRDGIELRLAQLREPALEIVQRSGVTDQASVEPTLDAATR